MSMHTTKSTTYRDKYGNLRCHCHDQYHSVNDEPAVTIDKGPGRIIKRWYSHGQLHRDDGPAIEWDDGGRTWYRNGQLHRDDGPAIHCADGMKRYYIDGVEQTGPKLRSHRKSSIQNLPLELQEPMREVLTRMREIAQTGNKMACTLLRKAGTNAPRIAAKVREQAEAERIEAMKKEMETSPPRKTHPLDVILQKMLYSTSSQASQETSSDIQADSKGFPMADDGDAHDVPCVSSGDVAASDASNGHNTPGGHFIIDATTYEAYEQASKSS